MNFFLFIIFHITGFITSEVKTTLTSISTATIGQFFMSDSVMQKAVWIIAIISGILATISGIQTQIDRYKKKHKSKKNAL